MEDDSVYGKALRKAFRLLSVRSRSCKELSSMLKDRGVPPDVTAQVVERLKELSYLDDDTFAREWSRHLAVNRLWGDRRIRISLREKGISDETAERAIAEARKEWGEQAAIERLIQKKYGKKRSSDIDSDVLKEKRRIMQNLSGRGFPAGLIVESLGKLREEDGDDGK
jgi:regulatory protein